MTCEAHREKRIMNFLQRLFAGLVGMSWVAASIAAEPVILQTQIVMDPQGFQEEAFRLLVPKGWRFDGGIVWDLDRFPAEAFSSYTVTSPDGAAAYEQFPHTSLFWAQDPMLQQSYAQSGFQVSPPVSVDEALRNLYLPNYRPQAQNARLLEVEPLPELAQQVVQWQYALMGVFSRISPPQFQYEIRADSARARYRYTIAGRETIEDVTLTIVYFIAQMPSMYGYVPAVTWSVAPRSFHAPAADMDKRLETFRIIAASVQDNPVWHEHNMTLAAVITREQLRQQQQIFKRLDDIRRSQSEMSDQLFESWQRRSAAQDRSFERYSQSIRGVETYSDPVSSRQVELPHGYRHAWSNGSDYVLSDDAAFDPNAVASGSWTEIHPAR